MIFPAIARSRGNAHSQYTPCSPRTSAPQSWASSEDAQIAVLRKQKDERAAKWKDQQHAFQTSIFELQRAKGRLEREITNLSSIAAAEAAVEARKNSWATWLLSPLYKQLIESEEEVERKDRARQERKIEKNLKERRLRSQQAELQEQETLMASAKADLDAANARTNQAIAATEARKRSREERERCKREREEWDRLEKLRRQQKEEQERELQEAWEAFEQRQAEAEAAAARYEELRRRSSSLHTNFHYYNST